MKKEIKDYLNNIQTNLDESSKKELLKFEAFKTIYNTISTNIPKEFEECISYKMLGWVVPFSIYENGYHCDTSLPLPFINLGWQKNHIGLYHMGLYADQKLLDWFVDSYQKEAKHKLDMGKSCIRFKHYDEMPIDLISELVKKITPLEWIKLYEKNFKN